MLSFELKKERNLFHILLKFWVFKEADLMGGGYAPLKIEEIKYKKFASREKNLFNILNTKKLSHI